MNKLSKICVAFVLSVVCSSLQASDCCEYSGPALRSDTGLSGFYIGATGVWAVPNETGLGTFTDSWQYANTDGSTTALSKPSKAHYKGAGGLKLGYDFPCSGNNVEVEYFRLYNSKHNVNDTSDNPVSFGSAFFNLGIPLTPGEAFVSDAHLKYTLNQVDAKFAHHFVIENGNVHITPFIGARYIDLKHDLTFLIGHVRSNYYGAGPLVGFDGEYRFCNGFAFAGRFDGAVVMGSVKADSFLNLGAALKYKSPRTDRIVYSVDARLGVSYSHTFCNQSWLKLEGGYKVANYHGPFDIIQGFTDIQRIGTLGTTNFGYSGPYLELTYHM